MPKIAENNGHYLVLGSYFIHIKLYSLKTFSKQKIEIIMHGPKIEILLKSIQFMKFINLWYVRLYNSDTSTLQNVYYGVACIRGKR